MSPRRCAKQVVLIFQCEWSNCAYISSSIEVFSCHMGSHLRAHLSQISTGEVTCLWSECGFTAYEGPPELERHIYFHVFHTKLKQLGLRVLDSCKAVTPSPDPAADASLLPPPLETEAAPMPGGACDQGVVMRSVPGCGLDSHTRNLVPELPDSFQCQWEGCERKFSHPEWFYRHVDSHTEQFKQPGAVNTAGGSITCLWIECEATCRSRFRLCEHLRTHTQERVVACPTCGGMFSNNTKLIDHVTRHQSNQVAAFQCSHCSKNFTSERILRDHMRHHINHYKCPFCDMTCPAPSSLRHHIRYRHEPGKPFPCSMCQHGCKNQADLHRHMETHTTGKPHRCDAPGCDFSARTLKTVRQHYRRVHQGAAAACYKCHCCEKVFSRGSILTRHLRVAHRFLWPPGYPRFRYQEHEDGYRRVQLVRYETVELAEQLIKDCEEEQQQMQQLEQQQQQQQEIQQLELQLEQQLEQQQQETLQQTE
ncbi:histone H4 transcription factor isoform X1 [Petromyzon marinus]|uniref:Histone H4 transcription factor n=1 Tax=Petromyzon marinus TaxID=7757 RepID=A0AAJ7U982_PETMA|nr:histone H4 transcription factor [Petromyzon marinus]